MKQYLHELYKRKDLVLYLVISGLKAEHRNSFLGYLWWLLDPFLSVLVYYFVVVLVFQRGGPDYGLFLVVGMIVWGWLSSAINTASRSIVSQSGIISQVYLPKIIFPLGATLTQLINFGFGLCVIALFLLSSGTEPGKALLWLPYITIIQLLFTFALGSVIAYVCTFIRDVNSLIGPLLRLWFFSSPVIWREDFLPPDKRWILELNPLAHFLAGYRGAFIDNMTPDILALSSIGVLSSITILFTVWFYSHYEHKIIKAL